MNADLGFGVNLARVGWVLPKLTSLPILESDGERKPEAGAERRLERSSSLVFDRLDVLFGLGGNPAPTLLELPGTVRICLVREVDGGLLDGLLGWARLVDLILVVVTGVLLVDRDRRLEDVVGGRLPARDRLFERINLSRSFVVTRFRLEERPRFPGF